MMRKKSFNQAKLKEKIFLSVIFILLFILLCSLGFWQLARAQQKRDILAQYQQQINHRVLDVSALNDIDSQFQYQSIELTGQYDNHHQLLLDNQFYQHQVGFEVLTPFHVDDKVILVNRGWVLRGTTRTELPQLKAVIGQQTLKGTVYFPPTYTFTLSHKMEENQGWPKIIESLNMMQITTLLKQNPLPYIIRLDADQDNGFARDWTIINLTPERHIGYAIQWFALAGVLLILYLIFIFKGMPEKRRKV